MRTENIISASTWTKFPLRSNLPGVAGVKRYRREKGEVVLISEKENHEPIRRIEGLIYISGVVKTAIRRNLSKL